MEKEHFILITPENRIQGIRTSNACLRFYYEVVNCRSIEIVRPFRDCPSCRDHVFVLDEEGRLKDEPRLNVIASMLVQLPLYGNVLIAKEGLRNGEPDIMGFDRAGAESVIRSIHFSLTGSGLFMECEEEGESE